jgi:hypothetical protein
LKYSLPEVTKVTEVTVLEEKTNGTKLLAAVGSLSKETSTKRKEATTSEEKPHLSDEKAKTLSNAADSSRRPKILKPM